MISCLENLLLISTSSTRVGIRLPLTVQLPSQCDLWLIVYFIIFVTKTSSLFWKAFIYYQQHFPLMILFLILFHPSSVPMLVFSQCLHTDIIHRCLSSPTCDSVCISKQTYMHTILYKLFSFKNIYILMGQKYSGYSAYLVCTGSRCDTQHHI